VKQEGLEHIKRTGTAQRGDVSVCIVRHLSGEGYAVETTVGGDRRYPTEAPMSIEEAQTFALGQLSNPRAAHEPQPEEPAIESGKSAKRKRVTGPPSPYELAEHFKAQGIGRQVSWSYFVKAMDLKPGMDVADWQKIYDGAVPQLCAQMMIGHKRLENAARAKLFG